MHKINLRSIDLNLLVVLQALLEERSITRAAANLYLTQSATSHALSRLRDLFDDQLLERRGATMELTAVAENLREPLDQIVKSVERLVMPEPVAIDQIKQTVHIGMADFPTAIFLPIVWGRLQTIAPGINLVVHDWHDANSEIERLHRGDISLALSTFNDLSKSICRVHLGDETYVGVARQDHPIGSEPTLEEWVSYSHVIVSSTGARTSSLDTVLGKNGLQRRVAVSVAGFLSVPSIVESSQTIALVPKSIANNWPVAKTLRQFKVPFETGSFSVDLAWHIRRDKDPAIQTVAKLIVEVFQELLQKG